MKSHPINRIGVLFLVLAVSACTSAHSGSGATPAVPVPGMAGGTPAGSATPSAAISYPPVGAINAACGKVYETIKASLPADRMGDLSPNQVSTQASASDEPTEASCTIRTKICLRSARPGTGNVTVVDLHFMSGGPVGLAYAATMGHRTPAHPPVTAIPDQVDGVTVWHRGVDLNDRLPELVLEAHGVIVDLSLDAMDLLVLSSPEPSLIAAVASCNATWAPLWPKLATSP